MNEYSGFCGPQNMYSYHPTPTKPKPDISQLARVIPICFKCGKPVLCNQCCKSQSPYGCQ